MGLLSQIFGEDKKTALIRELVTRRVAKDPLAATFGQSASSVRSWSTTMLYGFPEASLVTIVASYLTTRKAGYDDVIVIMSIEEHRTQFSGPATSIAEVASDSLSGDCLRRYIARRLAIDHPSGRPLTDADIDYCIKRAIEVFST